MNAFLGIDLCGPGVAVYRPKFEAPLHQTCTEVVRLTVGDPGPGAPLWEELRRPLLLDNADALSGLKNAALGKEVMPGLDRVEQALREISGRLREGLAPGLAAGARCAFVFPYRTPPALRRLLPGLLGARAVGTPVPPPVAVEAPVALAVEVVARRGCEPPADLVLVTGSGPARELTAVALRVVDRLQNDGSTLKTLVVRVLVAARAGTPAEVDAACAEVRRVAGGPPGRAGWKFAADGPADEVAEALAFPGASRCDPGGDGPDAPAFALALGAVRFTGLRRSAHHNGLPMLRGIAGAVEVAGPPYAPIGVLGTNREGRWCWRRLIPAGAELPVRAVVHSSQVGPRNRHKILFAECLGPAHRHRTWITEDEWGPARLSLHDFERASNPAKKDEPGVGFPDRHAWIFDYQERRPGENWAMPQWSLKYRPPS